MKTRAVRFATQPEVKKGKVKIAIKPLITLGSELAKLPSSAQSQPASVGPRRASVCDVSWDLRLRSPRLLSASVAKLLVFLLGAGLAAPTGNAAVHYQRLKSFGTPDLGVNPQAPLIQGS